MFLGDPSMNPYLSSIVDYISSSSSSSTSMDEMLFESVDASFSDSLMSEAGASGEVSSELVPFNSLPGSVTTIFPPLQDEAAAACEGSPSPSASVDEESEDDSSSIEDLSESEDEGAEDAAAPKSRKDRSLTSSEQALLSSLTAEDLQMIDFSKPKFEVASASWPADSKIEKAKRRDEILKAVTECKTSELRKYHSRLPKSTNLKDAKTIFRAARRRTKNAGYRSKSHKNKGKQQETLKRKYKKLKKENQQLKDENKQLRDQIYAMLQQQQQQQQQLQQQQMEALPLTFSEELNLDSLLP